MEEEKNIFELELYWMIKLYWNYFFIVNWIIFNEYWGVYDVEWLMELVMVLDFFWLVMGNSGIDVGKLDVDYEVGYIKDNYSYWLFLIFFGNNKRVIVNGEYGVIGYLLDGYVWDIDGFWVYYNYEGKEVVIIEYVCFIEMIYKF